MKKPKYIYSHCIIKAMDRDDLCRKINRRLTRGERLVCYGAMGCPDNAGRYSYHVTIETARD